MAITYPFDVLDGFPGWSVEFEPMYRQEQSRQANGRTIVKDLGSPLWRATYQSTTLTINALDRWRARLAALEGGLQTFRGYSLSRARPIAHPGIGGLPSGTISTINANRKAIAVTGLTGISLSPGDLIRIGASDLHRVLEAASGSPTGQVEIRPHLWPGVTTGATVSVTRPYCIMAMVPGSMNTQADLATGRGSVSFQAVEVR